MKKLVLIMSVMALFLFNCSSEDSATIDIQNVSDTQDVFTEQVNEIISNVEFQDMMTTQMHQRDGNEGNGVFVIQNPFSFIMGQMVDGKILFIGSFEDQYIAFMPNGTARFFAHSNNPLGAVVNLATFSTDYSNDCYDDPTGHFNSNVIGTYTEVVFPFGTVYFMDELQSASVMNGHTEVSDAQPIYNDIFEQIGCTDATEYKTLRVRPDGDGGSTITLR